MKSKSENNSDILINDVGYALCPRDINGDENNSFKVRKTEKNILPSLGDSIENLNFNKNEMEHACLPLENQVLDISEAKNKQRN